MGDFVFSIKHLCTCTGTPKVRTLTIMGAPFLTFSCTQNESVQDPIQNVTFTVNGEDFEMIQIQGGTFTMGCTDGQGCDCEDNEKPAHKETVSTFYMDKYEVTQKLRKAMIGSDSNPSANTGCGNCPVENVSWNEAHKFLGKLNVLTGKTFRLPTEIEWEYAACGGKRSEGHKYSGSNDIDEMAWYVKNYQEGGIGEMKTIHPVGLKRPGGLGLYDMSGNVWEWYEDTYTKEYYHDGKSVSPERSLKGATLFFRRVLRGGSWGGTSLGYRVSYIDYDIENYNDEYRGLRYTLDSNQE